MKRNYVVENILNSVRFARTGEDMTDTFTANRLGVSVEWLMAIADDYQVEALEERYEQRGFDRVWRQAAHLETFVPRERAWFEQWDHYCTFVPKFSGN